MSGALFEWNDVQKLAMRNMRERIESVPLVPLRPMEMIAKGWKIVIKSDGSDVGVGACMLLVKADAVSEITPELMLDPDRVRLLGVDSKVLSASERKWLTFEIEMYGMYRALRKWAGLLIQVSASVPSLIYIIVYINPLLFPVVFLFCFFCFDFGHDRCF